MGKVLVLFDTQSGNTGKMAASVAEGAASLAGTEVRLKHIDEATGEDLVWCDGAAVGSPTHLGQPSWKLKKWFDECGVWGRVDGRIGTSFSSEGGHAGGALLTCLSVQLVLMNFGFLILGITDYAHYAYTLHYGATTVREPRQPGDIAACLALGRKLALAVRNGHVDVMEEGQTGPRLFREKPREG
ncbi:MAG: flavodoxin domain-containing protein [Armatimonadetes bacterium]|nr:flavodoxin domain-containing protein [Armatimonadota bacterium]